MALNLISMEELSRIEDVIDALETRGVNSSSFFDLCKDLQERLNALTKEPTSDAGLDEQVVIRIKLIANRLQKLEAFASSQAEITTGLQKHIANPSK